MDFMFKITDKDVGEILYEEKKEKLRTAVRTIMLNEKNEVAVLYMKNKGVYKLVGGGVESGESLEETLKREVLEESGFEFEIIGEIRYCEEYRTRDKYFQTSYVYETKAIKNTKQLNLTDREKKYGAELKWFPIKDILKIMESNYKNIDLEKINNPLIVKIITKRDYLIIKYYIEKLEEK